MMLPPFEESLEMNQNRNLKNTLVSSLSEFAQSVTLPSPNKMLSRIAPLDIAGTVNSWKMTGFSGISTGKMKSASIQVVNIDYYLGKSFLQRSSLPINGHEDQASITAVVRELLDPAISYPIIRIFGTLQGTGKTSCAHIHGV